MSKSPGARSRSAGPSIGLREMKKAPRVPVLLLLSVSACGVACGDDEPQPDGGGGAGAGTTSVTTTASSGSGSGGGGGDSGLEIAWAPCPLSSDDAEGSEALCATIPVPLDWNDPNGAKIDFFVKKIPAEEQPARGQLWMLNGGPGYSGADFEGKVKAVTVDVYLPDHRGTGRSSRLGCPEQEADASPDGYWVNDAELAPCLDHMKMEWGDNVLGFTTTNAARDVGEVIEATRKADDKILVSGGSYGSMWANRYLQIYPDQSSGVVLDAFAVGLLLTRDDQYFNELGQRWMDACGADPVCGAKLGPDPWGAMTAALGALESGACPEILAQGWDRDELHLFWSFFFYTWEYRSLIAPMVYRIARCEPRDVTAMQNLRDVFTQPMAPTASQRFFSMLLSTHVMLSELWEDPPPTAAELEAYQSAANVAHGIAAPAQALYDAWPRYPKDAYAGGLADTNVPILMMRGEYDFIPMSAIEPAVEHFSSTGTFVEIPGSPHSPYAAPPAMGGPSCGTQILVQFFADPAATLDTSCTTEVAALPLVPSAQLSAAAFGVADPWEGTPASLAIQRGDGAIGRASAELARFRHTRGR